MQTDTLQSKKELQFLDQRIPRYTSCPTALQFNSSVDAAIYAGWLAGLPADQPLSIYLHVPFCNELCLYCGCHTTAVRHYSPVAAYAELLEREINIVGRHLAGRLDVAHVHWGGGTPTILAPCDFERLMNALHQTFRLVTGCEVAIEIDPRTVTHELVAALAGLGVTRASLGVQDFNEQVQKAVGRLQSFEVTARTAEWLRAAGIQNINLDLMYGLPYQTVDSVASTIRRALALDPDRIALFGYAHVPWMKRHQKLIPEEALPSSIERFAQYRAAAAVMTEAGYQAVGLDHFAKPGDPLARRQSERRIHRNFQGYTTDEASALIGFGTSAISALPNGYAQNAPATVAYRNAIEAERLATVRGCVISDDDRLRRDIIEQLMCNLEVNLADVAESRSRRLADFSTELAALDSLAEHDLVHRNDGIVTVPEHARPFVRTVCAVFDAYLTSGETRHSRAV
jgi:oxygen-independent coproporphyrinogen III oxidase